MKQTKGRDDSGFLPGAGIKGLIIVIVLVVAIVAVAAIAMDDDDDDSGSDDNGNGSDNNKGSDDNNKGSDDNGNTTTEDTVYGKTVTTTTSSNDNLMMSYSSDDLSDFTVTLGTSDSGATTVTVALADSVASSYSSYRWTLYQVIENSSTTYDYPVAKKPSSSNPLATTSDSFAIWTLGSDDTGVYKFTVSCNRGGGFNPFNMFSSGTEYTITLNITDLGTYTDTETVTKEMSWSYDGHAYTTTVTYDISEYTKYAQFNGASYTARSSFDDLTSFIVVNDVVTDITDDLASKYTATYSAEASGQGYAEFILAFVQCVFSYEYDNYLYGPDEYYAFPMETIQNQGGDCEDTSILAAALFKSAGYSAGVFLIPGHCIAAVALDSYTAGSVASGYSSQVALFSYTYTDGKTYYGCETTLDENLYGIGWISRTYSIDSDGEVYYTTTDMFGHSTTTNKVVSDGKTVTYKSLGYGFHPATA